MTIVFTAKILNRIFELQQDHQVAMVETQDQRTGGTNGKKRNRASGTEREVSNGKKKIWDTMKATIIPKIPELLKRNFDLMWRQRGLFLFRLVLLWYGVAMSSTGVAGADVMRLGPESLSV